MFVCPECGQDEMEPGFCPHDGHELVKSDDALLGTSIGPYRVAALIGQGGMGSVYKGIHPHIGSRVAIKVLNVSDKPSTTLQSKASAEQIERFFAEARAVNVIRHEHIVNILDFAKLPDGRPYLIMEYLDGAPLSTVIENAGELPLGSFGVVFVEILGALSAAHATSVIHRDLKPENIFVSPAGHAKVLDFGVAKIEGQLDSKTATGSLLGTPYYMSPEQARGEKVDHRADVFSMGTILYEGVTGQRPFDGKTLFEVLSKLVDSEPENPKKLRADLPKSFEKIIAKAMAKKPEDRFQSADEMAAAMRDAVEKLPQKAFAPLHPMGPPRDRTLRQVGVPAALESDPDDYSFDSKRSYRFSGKKSGKRKWVIGALSVVLLAGATVLVAQALKQEQRASDSEASISSAMAMSDQAVSSFTVESSTSTAATSSSGGSLAERTSSSSRHSQRTSIASSSRRSSVSRSATISAVALSSKNVASSSSFSIPAHPDVLDDSGKPSNMIDEYKDTSKVLAYSRYRNRAKTVAKVVYPDAKLKMLIAEGVRPDGKAHAQFLRGPYVYTFTFISQTAAKSKTGPVGADLKTNCNVTVFITKTGASVKNLRSDMGCEAGVGRMPKCSLKQVWKKAQGAGAPADGVATLMFSEFGGEIKWHFNIKDHFSTMVADDC